MTLAAAGLLLHSCMNLNTTPELSLSGTLLTMIALMIVLAIPKLGFNRFLPRKAFYYGYCGHLGILALASRYLA